MKLVLYIFFAALLFYTSLTYSANNPIENDVVLQVVVDRFRDGNQNNNTPEGLMINGKPASRDFVQRIFDPEKRDNRKFWGGDLQGLLEMVDEIADSGFSAIWISPHVLQSTTYDGRETAYHYYWAKDWFLLDPHLTQEGSRDFKLFQLVIDEFHRRGVKIIIDLVFNHSNPSDRLSSERQFHFHENGRIERDGEVVASYDQPFITPLHVDDQDLVRFYSPQAEFPQLYDYCNYFGPFAPNQCVDIFKNIYHLPDINLFSASAREYFKDAIDFWISFGVDGIRLDTYRNMAPENIKYLLSHAVDSFHRNRRVGHNQPVSDQLLIIGEYFGAGEYDETAYQYVREVKTSQGATPLLDFSLGYEIRKLFGDRGGKWYSANHLMEAVLAQEMNQNLNFDFAAAMYTFFDNHDNELLIHHTWNEAEKYNECSPHGSSQVKADKDTAGRLIRYREAINQAAALLLSIRGKPILYYATLQYIQPQCYPFNLFEEGACSRPMFPHEQRELIGAAKLKHIVTTLSRARRQVIDGRVNPDYHPAFVHGETRKLTVPSKQYRSFFVHCPHKNGDYSNSYDRSDLTLAFERCVDGNCMVFASSVNFGLREGERDAFQLRDLSAHPGEYRDLLTGKKYTVEADSTLNISLENYQTIILVPSL